MAERTGIMVLIRRHWKSILAAGIAAITVTALSVTTVTVATGGSIHIEGNGDLDITADSMIKSAGAADFLIESANSLSLSALGDGSVLAAAGSAHMDLVADLARLYVTGGGDVSASLGGLALSASSTGDDITLTSADLATMATTGGGSVQSRTSGLSLLATGAGDDIAMTAADSIALSVTAGDFGLVEATAANVILTTTNGGVVRTQTDGVVIDAASGGDDILINAQDVITVQAGNDLSFVVTDDITATCDALSQTGTTSITNTVGTTDWTLDASGFTLDSDGSGDDITITSADLVTMATDLGGQVQTSTTGVVIQAISTGDDVAITAADDVQVSATDSLLLTGASATLDGGSNGPLVPLVAGGTGYRIAPVLDFDYPNAAPASTAKTLMASQAIPAGALNAVGKGIGFVAMGTHLGNANVKRVSVEMGIAADTSGTGPTPQCNFNDATGTGWVVRGYFYRSGDDTQRAFIECMNNGIIQTVVTNATGALDDALPLFVNFTVENPTTAGDFTVHSVRWFWL